MIETTREIGTSSGDHSPDTKQRQAKLQRFLFQPVLLDFSVLSLFAGLAVCFQISRTHLTPNFMDLTGDAANIAGFAAALDHPELFEGE